MIEILVSEGKSWDPVRFYRNRVRVFVNKDYNYGVWVDEDLLFDVLDTEQQRQYLTDRSPEGLTYRVSREAARRIVSQGHSPYAKRLIP
jgi:hypothetical protein